MDIYILSEVNIYHYKCLSSWYFSRSLITQSIRQVFKGHVLQRISNLWVIRTQRNYNCKMQIIIYTWNVILIITVSINTLVYDNAKASTAIFPTANLSISLTIYTLKYISVSRWHYSICLMYFLKYSSIWYCRFLMKCCFWLKSDFWSKVNQQDIQNDTGESRTLVECELADATSIFCRKTELRGIWYEYAWDRWLQSINHVWKHFDNMGWLTLSAQHLFHFPDSNPSTLWQEVFNMGLYSSDAKEITYYTQMLTLQLTIPRRLVPVPAVQPVQASRTSLKLTYLEDHSNHVQGHSKIKCTNKGYCTPGLRPS